MTLPQTRVGVFQPHVATTDVYFYGGIMERVENERGKD